MYIIPYLKWVLIVNFHMCIIHEESIVQQLFPGFVVVEINPPESPHPLHTLNTPHCDGILNLFAHIVRSQVGVPMSHDVTVLGEHWGYTIGY